MKYIFSFFILTLCSLQFCNAQKSTDNIFPDGTPMTPWFLQANKINLNKLGKKFVITDHGAKQDSSLLQTSAIQQTIDLAASQGGGVIVIPKGIYLTGALFFKPKTSLYVSEGAVLKGSENIADFPIMPSRMEGQNLDYFPAVINAYGVDNFSISGKGTINGNGLKYWEAFWQRRKENPKCTNLEVSRPRLIFIRDCNNVQLQDVRLINSGFWTSHFYKCTNVKLLNLYIYSPLKPIKAPSTDAIDIDACKNVHIKGCYLSVNDDAIAIKGGKGPWADTDKNNGANENILVEDCTYGFCHSSLTMGSESIHNKNIVIRNCTVHGVRRLLWLKMRPDTPQQYEFIRVENIKGESYSMIDINPWTQFFDLKGRTDMPLSSGSHITMKNIDLKCEVFFDVNTSKNYTLSDFQFENLKIESRVVNFNTGLIKNVALKNITVLPIQVKDPLKEQPLE